MKQIAVFSSERDGDVEQNVNRWLKENAHRFKKGTEPYFLQSESIGIGSSTLHSSNFTITIVYDLDD